MAFQQKPGNKKPARTQAGYGADGKARQGGNDRPNAFGRDGGKRGNFGTNRTPGQGRGARDQGGQASERTNTSHSFGKRADVSGRPSSGQPYQGRQQRNSPSAQYPADRRQRPAGDASGRMQRRGPASGPDRYQERTVPMDSAYQQRRFGPQASLTSHRAHSPETVPFVSGPAFAAAEVSEVPENLLSGRNPIREALKTGRDIEKLLVASGELSGSAREIVAMAKEAGIIVQVVERSRLDQITRNHQGMVAFASAFAYSTIEEMLDVAKEKGEDPFLIVLDKITDPQNLGAIIRTAACVGAHGVVVQLHRAVGLTPSAVRASAGGVEHVKVARVVNINNAIKDLKKKGVWVYAADAAGRDFAQVQFEGPCALVIGNEGEGVSQHTLELCDDRLSIPMSGAIDSLNASVAAGVLMYAVYLQRVRKG